MIGKLRGNVDWVDEQEAIIDVGGVGYIVYCSAMTLRSFPPIGNSVQLWIETHVREDHIHLYGFVTIEEKTWFNRLVTVKGVGARVALAILSVMDASQLSTALISQDKAAFKPVAGVGPKLAERIITELKDKSFVGDINPISEQSLISQNNTENQTGDAIITDAVSALTNLGYGRSEAFLKVTQLAQQNKPVSVESLIRDSLKELAS